LVSVGSPAASRVSGQTDATTLPFLIGGYGEGLYLSELNTATGDMAPARLLIQLASPSFFCQHPTLDIIYCVSETRADDRTAPATITSLAWDKKTQSLTILNQQPIGSSGPCYVSTTPMGELAMVANYSDGTLATFPIEVDGRLKERLQLIEHRGTGTNQNRQSEPHAHSIVPDPTGRWVCAADLGTNNIHVYAFDSETLSLSPNPSGPTVFALPPGSGPRHLIFDPDHSTAYVLNELTSTLEMLSWDAAMGQFKKLDLQSTLPDDFSGNNSTAEVLIHPNGNYVYASNRGHNSIAAFKIIDNKRLQPIGHCSTGGETPRNFRIDPSGKFLLAENQNSDSVYVLAIDKNGQLSNTNTHIDVPKPACIKFIRQPSN
jgi:6-phosphogluconolactonase